MNRDERKLTQGGRLSEKERELIEQVRKVQHGKIEAVVLDGELTRLVKIEHIKFQ